MKKENEAQSVSQSDLDLINDLNGAFQQEKHRGYFAVVILLFVLIVVFLIWAYNSTLEEVTRGQGSIISSSREQIIQSLDPGTIMEMGVKEGDVVEKDQILLKLDDTRSSAVLRESEAKVESLSALAARLKAETTGTEPVFPQQISNEIKQREYHAFVARRQSMLDAVSGLKQSKSFLDHEISITQPLAQQGLVSNVEVLRMQRQSADLGLQITERKNRYLTDANNELVKTEAELAQARENMLMRADPVERSLIRAPLRGVVKNIKINRQILKIKTLSKFSTPKGFIFMSQHTYFFFATAFFAVVVFLAAGFLAAAFFFSTKAFGSCAVIHFFTSSRETSFRSSASYLVSSFFLGILWIFLPCFTIGPHRAFSMEIFSASQCWMYRLASFSSFASISSLMSL